MSDAQPITVRELIAVYLRHCAAVEKHESNTRRKVEKLLLGLEREFGDRAVDSLRAFELRDWIELCAGWRKSGTRRTNAGYLKAPFRWAFEDGRIGRNPFIGVRYPKGERAPALPDESIAKLTGAVTADSLGAHPPAKGAHWRFVMAIEWLRMTGCRVSELCACRWEDVDFDAGEWIVNKHKTRKTKRKARKFFLIPQALDLIRVHRQESGPVFLNTRGTKAWTRASLWSYFDRWRSKLTPDELGSVHGIRHTFATQGLLNGAALKAVSMNLGHANVATTEENYLDLDNEAEFIRDAARKSIAKRGKC